MKNIKNLNIKWLKLKFFFNNEPKEIQDFIVDKIFKCKLDFEEQKKIILLFASEESIFTVFFKNLILKYAMSNKNDELSLFLLDMFDFNFNNNDTSRKSLFTQLHQYGQLFYTNYPVWLFFVLINDKYAVLSKKESIMELIRSEDKILKIIKHRKLISYFRNIENRKIILENCFKEQYPIIQKILLEIDIEKSGIVTKESKVTKPKKNKI